ncbi:MAG: hypothetical protein PVH47_08780 [Thiohalocapsa sp.]|jgi:hypothetical protein
MQEGRRVAGRPELVDLVVVAAARGDLVHELADVGVAVRALDRIHVDPHPARTAVGVVMGVQAAAVLLRAVAMHVRTLLARLAARPLPVVQDLVTLLPDQLRTPLVERLLVGLVDGDDLEVSADDDEGSLMGVHQ